MTQTEPRCDKCAYYTPKENTDGVCSIPLWRNSELYQMHYTKPEDNCNLYEEKQ